MCSQRGVEGENGGEKEEIEGHMRDDTKASALETTTSPNKWDMESQVAISCRQAGLSVEGKGHQPSHKTINAKFVLHTRYAATTMEQRLRG